MEEHIVAIESLLSRGLVDEARDHLQQLATSEVKDVDLLLRVADLCQGVGWVSKLVVELNRAFQLAPDRLEILKKLGRVHTDGGRNVRAVKCWQAITERDPSDVEAWEELGAALTLLERHEEAREVYRAAERATGDRRFQGLLRETAQPPEAPAPSEEWDDAVVGRFLHLFSGREGVYARQWANPQGETGYSPIREPFTMQVARAHLQGLHTVGTYLLRLDNTVNFAAIDLDLPRDLLVRTSRAESSARMRELREYALRMAVESGLVLHLEESGHKGYHIWFLFNQPMPARLARRLAQVVARRAGPPPAGVGVEIFPKQVEVPPEGLGNLIKLPLGVHRLSGRRSLILNDVGLAVTDPTSWIRELRTLDRDEVYAYLEGIDQEEPEAVEPVALALSPAPVEYHLDSDLAVQNILARCCTLRALVDRAMYQHQLTHDEARALIHTLGHLDTGPHAVNVVLRKAPESDSSLFMKSRLRGNPMSCARIRERLPHITSRLPCNCEFALEAGMYPNPLLHLQSRDNVVTALQLRTLVEDYLRSVKELREATVRQAQYSERLSEWFERAGLEELPTPMGTLRRVRSEDGRVSFALEM